MGDHPTRRYSESEVEEIFERATEAQARGSRSRPTRDGLTLKELQEIGREVGVSPDLIESAARSLDAPESTQPTTKRLFGVPIGVGRTVSLPRRLTDEEWHRLVGDLRETFDARGKVREEGRFREWTNGNLQALLEPAESGERLRLRTVKGSARPGLGVGVGLFGGGVFFWLLDVLTGGEMGEGLDSMLPLIVVGAFFLVSNLVRLPRWAAARERQMEGVAARTLAAVEAKDPTSVEAGDRASTEGSGT